MYLYGMLRSNFYAKLNYEFHPNCYALLKATNAEIITKEIALNEQSLSEKRDKNKIII